MRETALDEGFLESLGGAGSFSGVEVLSLSAFAPGDRLDDLEGFDSLGEVEALRTALKADAFSRKPSSILTVGDASALRSSSSILSAQVSSARPTVVCDGDSDGDQCGKGSGARVRGCREGSVNAGAVHRHVGARVMQKVESRARNRTGG